MSTHGMTNHPCSQVEAVELFVIRIKTSCYALRRSVQCRNLAAVKRFVRQFLSVWLALSCALAGMVGLSPLLHQWVEHGGQGPAHIHRGSGVASAHAHKPGHAHSHDHSPGHSHAGHHHHHGGDHDEPGPDHEHGSLAQLLASGLVDLNDGLVFDAAGVSQVVARIQFPDSLLHVNGIDLRTAGRGPPSHLG